LGVFPSRMGASCLCHCELLRGAVAPLIGQETGQRRPSRSEATYRGQAGYPESRSLDFDTLCYSIGARSPGFTQHCLFLSRRAVCAACPEPVEGKQSPSTLGDCFAPLAMTQDPGRLRTLFHSSTTVPSRSKLNFESSHSSDCISPAGLTTVPAAGIGKFSSARPVPLLTNSNSKKGSHTPLII